MLVRASPSLNVPMLVPKVGFVLPSKKNIPVVTLELKPPTSQLPELMESEEPSEWFMYTKSMKGTKQESPQGANEM